MFNHCCHFSNRFLLWCETIYWCNIYPYFLHRKSPSILSWSVFRKPRARKRLPPPRDATRTTGWAPAGPTSSTVQTVLVKKIPLRTRMIAKYQWMFDSFRFVRLLWVSWVFEYFCLYIKSEMWAFISSMKKSKTRWILILLFSYGTPKERKRAQNIQYS